MSLDSEKRIPLGWAGDAVAAVDVQLWRSFSFSM